MNTQKPERGNYELSPRYYNSTKILQIAFRSKRVDQLCDGYVCVGDAIMHGVTEEIAIFFEIKGWQKDLDDKEKISFEGEFKVDRREFGPAYDATPQTRPSGLERN